MEKKKKRRRVKEEKHYIPIACPVHYWKQFREIMREEGIKSYTFAFAHLLKKAVNSGHIL